MKKVVKFGGSSLASAEQFTKVKDIICSDSDRRYVVPSAPGKRFSGDTKVTDMLYTCYAKILRHKGSVLPAAYAGAKDPPQWICCGFLFLLLFLLSPCGSPQEETANPPLLPDAGNRPAGYIV